VANKLKKETTYHILFSVQRDGHYHRDLIETIEGPVTGKVLKKWKEKALKEHGLNKVTILKWTPLEEERNEKETNFG